MKVLWVGDALVSSGFAACTHAVCDHLHKSGDSVHVLGLNYFGDPHSRPYDVYPCRQPFDGGYDAFGVGRLPLLMARIKPDVVVILNDPWNVRGYIQEMEIVAEQANRPDILEIPIVPWLAVDGKNQQSASTLNHKSIPLVITWTEFGRDELVKGGYQGPASVTPLGVDETIFYPRDRAESRAKVVPAEVPADAFIVGVVGRNQPRKRLDLTIAYFAEWFHNSGCDAWLYLHVAPTGDLGYNLRSLIRYHGLTGRVVLAEPYIGHGMASDLMPYVYSSFDVCLTTTQGEGWGLCTLEAMACGVPNIVPAWSALNEHDGGWPKIGCTFQVECTSTAITAPMNGNPYTIGGVPDLAATVDALIRVKDHSSANEVSIKGRQLARSLTWHRTIEMFREELSKVVANHHG